MNFLFQWLKFEIQGDKITCNDIPFAEVQIAGEDKAHHLGMKSVCTSEGARLKYISHEQKGNTLSVLQKGENVCVRTVFASYSDSSAVRIVTEVENISGRDIGLEQVSSFVLGLGGKLCDAKDFYLTRFTQSHHGECQPRAQSLFDMGLTDVSFAGQYRVGHSNVGSWSTKEELPQGIIHHGDKCIMFQIESNNSWNYEISDENKDLYLYLGGANETFGGWFKNLTPGEKYTAPAVVVAYARDVEAVVGEMTKYRRYIAGKCESDGDMPVIFNEYMHLSWDSPSEEGVRRYAPKIAEVGADYYVIDCGWHDEVPGGEVYPYVGKWVESNARFPHGVRATTDYIRSLGMKAGLWIEPEIVGKLCQEMTDYYGDDCFICRHGKKVCAQGRYFLDFRKKKVTDYLTETIRRMVEDYGAQYIKLDYNQDIGIGCDEDADSMGDGLEKCSAAYLDWIDGIRNRFPSVLFETCSSGGMRMDYQTLSHFSIVSTSDQIKYKKYPYIAGNILSAVLPEQAAVWSYPVGSPVEPNGLFDPSREWVEENISCEQIIINMINSFLGRIHLASHIELLSDEKFALVKEGIEYYKSLVEAKREALPIFPLGFTNFEQKCVAAGFKSKDKLYLAVWNLGGERRVEIPVAGYLKAKCSYPCSNKLNFDLKNDLLIIDFSCDYQARFFELY